MNKVTKAFTEFMADEEAWDMFVTGPAGSGKTTQLNDQVQYCIDNDIEHMVCAFTHKACEILISKLPEKANVKTLHSWLKKRPGINTNATDIRQVDISTRSGSSSRPKVVFIDEYSMIGEKDGIDIAAEQDPDYEGTPSIKVVYLGDANQLPPVGDVPYVKPYGKYAIKLTKIYRQAGDSPLMDVLAKLVNMINGGEPEPLGENSAFIRGQDLVSSYEHSKGDSRILVYTNQRVEELNREIQGRELPEPTDILFSPTTRREIVFNEFVESPESIETPFNGSLHLDSKYKTLEHLIKSKTCAFADTSDGVLACVFGHYQYKLKYEELKAAAAKSNMDIEKAHRGYKASAWAKHNPKTKLARARAKAWRDFLSFDECVVCLDFNHAMTVHKSQGSTFESVLIDTEDLYKCAKTNYQLYLKLMYVAISRARTLVVTN